MRPARRLLLLLGLLILAAALLPVMQPFMSTERHQQLADVWWVVCGCILLLAIIDAWWSKADLALVDASREVPNSLALGVDNDVRIRVQHQLKRPLQIEINDDYPQQVAIVNLPVSLRIEPQHHADIDYQLRPLQRGDAHFGRLFIRVLSRLQFWQYRIQRAGAETVRIYPNFRSIANFKTLGLHQQTGQMGIHIKPRRGQGLDFHQLREFREGDSLNQIDWKATARMRKPIAREYQDERDQDIIFMIDCGRRMHARHGELSHFDHVLNAFLLTSHVALKQGDAVGLLSFAGDQRWLSPLKGQHSVNTLMNHVYDLHSSTDSSDFSQAAQQLISHQRKRSLIILITNLHDEDADDLQPAIQLLRRQHLVIVANLREQFLDDNLQQPITDFKSALAYAGTSEFLGKRHRLLETLRKQGVFIADALPHRLHVDLINEYLALKRRGQI